MTALVVILVTITLLSLRTPVAWALLIPSLAYLIFATPLNSSAAIERMVISVNGFPLLAVPLFILVGTLADATGLASRLFSALQPLVGRVRGGIAYVGVAAALGFSWMSGNAVSDVAVMGTVQVPEMQKRGYSDRFIAGIVTASSLVTPLIPPSIPAIIFGVASGVSIGAILIAGIVPGLILVILLLLMVWLYSRKRDDLRSEERVPGSRRRGLLALLPILPAPVIVLGGILSGLFTPTEAAAAACLYVMAITAFFYRSLNRQTLVTAFRSAVRTTGSVMFIVTGAAVFSWVLTLERVPNALADAVLAVTDNPTVFLLLLIVAMLVLGCFVDPVSGLLISTPVLYPVATLLGVDPLHFGMVLIFSLLIGLFTPPVGLALFVMESTTTIKLPVIIRGVAPFVAMFVLFAVLMAAVPAISTWLPSLVLR